MPLLLLTALVLGAIRGPGVPGSDLVLLLEIGVSERDIADYGARMGGFEPLDGEALARVEDLGATPAFVRALPRSVPDFGDISEIASTSDVFEDDRLGVGFVHPAAWTVVRTVDEDGVVILRIAPRSVADPRAFVSPALFVFVLEDSGLVPEASGPVREQLARSMGRRLRAAGLRPSPVGPGSADLLGVRRDTSRLEAATDGPHAGVLEIAFEVEAAGRAVGVGFTSSAEDRGRMEPVFRRLAGSLVLRAGAEGHTPRRRPG